MRALKYVVALFVLALAPAVSLAAGEGVSVRAISFVGLHEKGQTDGRLAPYQGMLKQRLQFESFRSTGEGRASVAPGSSGTVSAGGASVRIEVDPQGGVRAEFGGNSVQLRAAAVFNTGENKGIIVLRN